MDLALLFFAFLWGLSGKARGESPGDIKPSAPRQLPPSSPGGQASTSPWPQVTPSGLPPFPGPGWEFDEPPPPAVKQRAGQLVSQLWKGGAGTFRTEQTEGRWITYVAAIVASGKRGVVAYREKRAGAPRAPRASSTARRTPAPARPGMPATIIAVTSPGWPQPASSRSIQVQKGRWYRWTMQADFTTSDKAAARDGLKRGLVLGGAKDVEVSDGPPFRLVYVMLSQATHTVAIGAPSTLRLPSGETATATVLDAVEVKEKTPSGSGPIAMTQLQRGAGMKPQPPSEQVKVLQRRLGISDDGRFGAGTEAAVKAFQTSKGLKVDGIVGPATWGALFQASQRA